MNKEFISQALLTSNNGKQLHHGSVWALFVILLFILFKRIRWRGVVPRFSQISERDWLKTRQDTYFDFALRIMLLPYFWTDRNRNWFIWIFLSGADVQWGLLCQICSLCWRWNSKPNLQMTLARLTKMKIIVFQQYLVQYTSWWCWQQWQQFWRWQIVFCQFMWINS